MSQPKILYLITKSNFGGAQKQVYELACEAKKRNYDVVVACGGTGTKRAETGRLVTLLEEAHITVLPIKHFMRNISLFEEILAFFEVVRMLRKEKPDILHVTSSKAGGIGAIAGRLTGCKRIIFTSHGLTMDESWRPHWQILLISLFTWLTILLSHHTIMISIETYNRVRRMPLLAKKVSLIFNGISPITFLGKNESRTRLLPDVALTEDLVVIGGSGELHPNKNWSSLIKLMPNFPKYVHLLIIGEGEERAALESLVKELNLQDRVHLPGYINDAPQFYTAFDVFILPSKKEGLPYVILEAGLAKLPVIASDLPGMHDIITDNKNGYLVRPDSDRLGESIHGLIKDKGLRQRLGAELAATVHAKFSIERMFTETFSTYSPSPQQTPKAEKLGVHQDK